jgi:hypothetical protein
VRVPEFVFACVCWAAVATLLRAGVRQLARENEGQRLPWRTWPPTASWRAKLIFTAATAAAAASVVLMAASSGYTHESSIAWGLLGVGVAWMIGGSAPLYRHNHRISTYS